MIPQYPAGLPCPQSSVVTAAERRALSNANRPREARQSRYERQEFERLTWPPMPRARCQLLLDFWRDTLVYGGSWFTADWPLPRGSVSVRRKFLEQPRWEFIAGGMWRISAVCEVVGGVEPETIAAGWWWDFEDVAPATTFRDRGPTATDMKALPDLATVSTASGMAGRAADRGIGGTGRLIYAPRTDTTLDFGPTDSFSFGIWVYPTSLPSDGWTKGVMGRWAAPKDPPGETATGFDGNIHTSYGLCVLNGLANLYMIQPGAIVRSILDTELALNAWQLMVGVIDVTGGEMRLGVDEDDFSETAITAGPRNDVTVQGNFIFGQPLHSDATAGMDFAQRQFGGRMDRAFVTRRLLSQEDREWLHNAGAGRSYPQAVSYGLFTP